MQGDGGLIKKIIKEGSGWETPSKSDDVTVIYHGTLEDGTVFDSSRDRGDTFNFTLGQGQGEAQIVLASLLIVYAIPSELELYILSAQNPLTAACLSLMGMPCSHQGMGQGSCHHEEGRESNPDLQGAIRVRQYWEPT